MNVRKNIKYVNLIYDIFAGDNGELTAITQYIYEHIELNRFDNFSKILLSIAIEEMHHLSLLGDLIKKLGGVPYFVNNNQCNWNTKNVKYHFTSLYDMLSYNIESEKKAIDEYKKIIKYTKNQSIKNLIERIVLDEQTHLEIFNRLR